MSRTRDLARQMAEDLGDGGIRLWHLPSDMLLVLRKIETDSGRGVVWIPQWLAHSWFGQMRALSSKCTVLSLLDAEEPLLEGQRGHHEKSSVMVTGLR